MDARVSKLRMALDVDVEIAEALVKARLDTPRKIKAANDKDLLAVPGVGQSRLATIRKRAPRERHFNK